MSDSGDKKDDKSSLKKSGDDEFDWDAALDQWDKGFEPEVASSSDERTRRKSRAQKTTRSTCSSIRRSPNARLCRTSMSKLR
jgi:hypothetical protein